MSFQDQDIMEDFKKDEASLVKSYASALTGSNCPVLKQDISQLFSNTLENLNLVGQKMTDHNWVSPQFAQDSDVEQAVMTYQQKQSQLQGMMKVDANPNKQPGVQAT